MLLQDLLHVVVLLADGVREPGGALSNKQLALGQRIVVAAENSSLKKTQKQK
jgi:hypothetical protein